MNFPPPRVGCNPRQTKPGRTPLIFRGKLFRQAEPALGAGWQTRVDEALAEWLGQKGL